MERLRGEEFDAAAVQLTVGEVGDAGDARRNEDGWSSRRLRRERHGDRHRDVHQVEVLGLEAHSPARHVNAHDDVIAKSVAAHAREVIDLGAHPLAALEGWRGSKWYDRAGRRKWVRDGACRRRIEKGYGSRGRLRLCRGRARGHKRAQRRQVRGLFPDRGHAAIIAIAHQSSVNGADIKFKVAVLDGDGRAATAAFKSEDQRALLGRRGRRKFELPEIARLIQEGDAIGVDTFVLGDFANDAGFDFPIGDHGTDMELLLGDELVCGDDSGAMKAENHGLGDFGEDAAIGIAAD